MKPLTRKEQLEYLKEFLKEQIEIYTKDLELVEKEYKKILKEKIDEN